MIKLTPRHGSLITDTVPILFLDKFSAMEFDRV